MKPPVDMIRLPQVAKDQMVKLKRHTGIEHWNVLCRWALCSSLRDASKPLYAVQQGSEAAVEVPWRVFAGEYSDAYAALVYLRAHQDGLTGEPDSAALCLKAHLIRGLGCLASEYDDRTIGGFLERWAIAPRAERQPAPRRHSRKTADACHASAEPLG